MGERGSYASGQEMTRPEVTKHHARASRKTEMGVGCKRAMGKAKSMLKREYKVEATVGSQSLF